MAIEIREAFPIATQRVIAYRLRRRYGRNDAVRGRLIRPGQGRLELRLRHPRKFLPPRGLIFGNAEIGQRGHTM
jgi:hypothetical protein